MIEYILGLVAGCVLFRVGIRLFSVNSNFSKGISIDHNEHQERLKNYHMNGCKGPF